MDLHKLLSEYAVDETWYNADGYTGLVVYLLSYANNHPWFHYHATLVPDSNEKYFHYVVLYWTEGQRPTINTFNFVRV